MLSAPASEGDTTLEMASMEGFAAGDFIRINPGGDNEEDNQIASIGSCHLVAPLKFAHDAGERVVKISPAGLPLTGAQPAAGGSGTPWLTVVIAALFATTGGLSLAHRARRHIS